MAAATEEAEKKRVGRPATVGATIKTTVLIDPARMEALNSLASATRRSRNDLWREAVDVLIAKYERLDERQR